MINQSFKTFRDYSGQERLFLAALPYRVGLWISQVDNAGGGAAKRTELESLERVISSISGNFCGSVFVQELTEETLAHRHRWAEWSKNIDNVPGECQRALDLLSGEISIEDEEAFKNDLMEVAVTVAKAYSEFFEEEGVSTKIQALAGIWLDKFVARMQGLPEKKTTELEDLHISFHEEQALGELARVLHPNINSLAGQTNLH